MKQNYRAGRATIPRRDYERAEARAFDLVAIFLGRLASSKLIFLRFLCTFDFSADRANDPQSQRDVIQSR
jgi:hypothetical protein